LPNTTSGLEMDLAYSYSPKAYMGQFMTFVGADTCNAYLCPCTCEAQNAKL